jgi:threonine aldolase
LRIDARSVETNLVYFDVTDSRFDAEKICAALFKRGVRMSQMGTHTVRAVTHLDVDANGIDVALEHLREVLKA